VQIAEDARDQLGTLVVDVVPDARDHADDDLAQEGVPLGEVRRREAQRAEQREGRRLHRGPQRASLPRDVGLRGGGAMEGIEAPRHPALHRLREGRRERPRASVRRGLKPRSFSAASARSRITRRRRLR
jgi:hypothetical protein